MALKKKKTGQKRRAVGARKGSAKKKPAPKKKVAARKAKKPAPKRPLKKIVGKPRPQPTAKASTQATVNVILLGPPGAGKGTQAEKLTVALSIPHMSTGNAFRAAIAAGSELGKQVEPIMKAGGLVPDALVIALVDERLTRPDCSQGALFDGYPRTIPQADALEVTLKRLGRAVSKVLLLEVNDELIVDRMSGRRSCPNDGSVYHVVGKPPKVPGQCDRCNGPLTIRDDDKPETVRARLLKYHQDTAPLVAYYEPRGVLVRINGMGSPDEVFAAALAAVRS